MHIQRKNLFLTWGIRISLVPVILVLFALGMIAIVLFAICGVCGRFLAALGGRLGFPGGFCLQSYGEREACGRQGRGEP